MPGTCCSKNNSESTKPATVGQQEKPLIPCTEPPRSGSDELAPEASELESPKAKPVVTSQVSDSDEGVHYNNDPKLPKFYHRKKNYSRVPGLPEELQDNFPEYPFDPAAFAASENVKLVELSNDYKYRGEWDGPKMHGIGELHFPDGGVFAGTFVDNCPSGIGIITTAKGTRYIGEYKGNCSEGFGRYDFDDGSITIGTFVEGKKNGIGKEIRPNGTVFIGNYKDGVRSGMGFLVTGEQEAYLGTFEDGQISGEGTYWWPDGKVYRGFWSKTHMNGQGTEWWPSGQIYKGEFVQGAPAGLGVLQYPDGKQAIGHFTKGQLDGEVTIYQPNGLSRKAEFNGGIRVKWLDQQIESSMPEPLPAHPGQFPGFVPKE